LDLDQEPDLLNPIPLDREPKRCELDPEALDRAEQPLDRPDDDSGKAVA
jgi:hypothetical protein